MDKTIDQEVFFKISEQLEAIKIELAVSKQNTKQIETTVAGLVSAVGQIQLDVRTIQTESAKRNGKEEYQGYVRDKIGWPTIMNIIGGLFGIAQAISVAVILNSFINHKP